MRTVVQLLAEISEAAGLSMLFIGGRALQAYGVIRQTLDVDVLISERQAKPLGEALRRIGYAEVVRSEIFARYRHASPDLADVDVLYLDADTADKMSRQAQACVLDGTPCRVPDLSHLVALKLHAIRQNPAREPRDFADIVELLRANPERIGRDDLRRLCAKYGPEGLGQKLEESLCRTN
jgi:hypothetical protein